MNYLIVFLVGGALCAIGQLLLSLTKVTTARLLVLYVVSGVVLGALGVYGHLVEFAHAGATVPLTGFGYSLYKGAVEGAAKDGVIGAFTGGISATAGGVAAAIVFAFLAAFLSRPRTKK